MLIVGTLSLIVLINFRGNTGGRDSNTTMGLRGGEGRRELSQYLCVVPCLTYSNLVLVCIPDFLSCLGHSSDCFDDSVLSSFFFSAIGLLAFIYYNEFLMVFVGT